MIQFKSLMRRADTLRRAESDPARDAWWTGYIRGLRRAHHGDRFGTEAEHEMWIGTIDSPDPQRNALGLGYRAGLSMEFKSPPGTATDSNNR